MINEIKKTILDLENGVGSKLINHSYKDLSNLDLAEIYMYAVLNFGRNHIRTNMVIDEIRSRKTTSEIDQYFENKKSEQIRKLWEGIQENVEVYLDYIEDEI